MVNHAKSTNSLQCNSALEENIFAMTNLGMRKSSAGLSTGVVTPAVSTDLSIQPNHGFSFASIGTDRITSVFEIPSLHFSSQHSNDTRHAKGY